MRRRDVHLLLSLALIFLLSNSVAPEEKDEAADRRIVVITHVDNEVFELTRVELGRMFLKSRTTWDGNERCVPIDQSGASEIRQRFYEVVLNRSVNDMKRYWMQETMTGNAKPPVTLENSATVKKYIAKLEGGIGYIFEDELDDSVKAIRLVDIPEFYDPKANSEDDDESAATPDKTP